MALSEAVTRAKPIDPALHARGWTESLESPTIFDAPIVRAAGGLKAWKTLGKPEQNRSDATQRIFAG